MRRQIVLILILACLLSGGVLARSAPRPAPDTLWALIIGISNYAHATPLEYAARDAVAVADFLKSPRGGSIPQDHIVTLIEDEATFDNVILQLDELAPRIKPGDRVYVYIAGHGYLRNRSGYFVPFNGKFSVPSTGVNFAQIRDMIEAGYTAAAARVLITDLCNAGRLGMNPELPPEAIANTLNDEVLKLHPGGKFLNLMATGPTEASWEKPELGHGVFTYSLLEALEGKANPGQPVILADKVVDYLRREVPRLTGYSQNPLVNSDFDPALELSFTDLPGPTQTEDPSRAQLVLRNTDRSPFLRVEWLDARSQSKVLRDLPKDRDTARIDFLTAGPLDLKFYGESSQNRSMTIQLKPGDNVLDLSPTSTFLERTASLVQRVSFAAFLPQLPAAQQATPAEARVLFRAPSNTEIRMDNIFFETTGANGELVQIAGLDPGRPHELRLLAPGREYRFRLKLFAGLHVLDINSHELRFVSDAPPAPSSIPMPPSIPSRLAGLVRQFEQAVWEERLIEPAGDNAWEHFQALRNQLPETDVRPFRNRLIVALGNKARRTLLRYLSGGDIRWSAAAFDEGYRLVNLQQQLFRPVPRYQADERFFEGRALIERANYDRAIQVLQSAVSLDPDSAYSYNAIGLAYWKQSRLDSAIPPLQRAIELAPEWSYPRSTLSYVYMEQRRYPEAEMSFRDAIQADPDDSSAHHGLAQLEFLLNRLPEAEIEVSRAIDTDPGNAYAYDTFGKIRLTQGQRADAEQMFRTAIRLEPDEPAFRADLAQMLVEQAAREAEGETMFRQLAAQRPRDIGVINAEAKFLAGRNRNSDANALFKHAIAESPEDSNLRVLYAGQLLKQGDFSQAERQLKTAIRSNSANAFAFYNLAVLNLQRRHFADAEKAAQASVSADPRFANPLHLLGKIRYAQQRYADSRDFYERAMGLAPDRNEQQELCDDRIQNAHALSNQAIANSETWSGYVTAFRNAQLEASFIARSCSDFYNPADAQESLVADARDAVLDFQQRHPESARIEDLRGTFLYDALATAFWKDMQQAEQLWTGGGIADALQYFAQAVTHLRDEDARAIGSRAFNLRNAGNSIHDVIHRWGMRMVDEQQYTAALELMQHSIDHRFYCAVSATPPQLDSLVLPSSTTAPQSCSDYEVTSHVDVRAHEVFAAAYAGLGDLARMQSYLTALNDSPGLPRASAAAARVLNRTGHAADAIQLLKPQLVTSAGRTIPPDFFAALSEAYAATGDIRQARQTLRAGQKLYPKDARLRAEIPAGKTKQQ